MSYQRRALVGLLVLFASFGILLYSSPARTGISSPDPIWVYSFVGVFALGFTLFTMGILGHQDAYTAFVSGFVLYLLIGGVITMTLYVTNRGLLIYSLEDAGNPAFWGEAMRMSILWPLTLVQLTGVFGWEAFRWQ